MYEQMSLDSGFVSLGSILGTAGSSELLDRINNSQDITHFSQDNYMFKDRIENFKQKVVMPLVEAGITLQNTAKKFFQPNVIKPIQSTDDLLNIPPVMHQIILGIPEVREHHENGCLFGFGVDPVESSLSNPYTRIFMTNETVMHSSLADENGEIEEVYTEDSTDPIHTQEEWSDIYDTRDWISLFYENPITAKLDVTDYPNPRGLTV